MHTCIKIIFFLTRPVCGNQKGWCGPGMKILSKGYKTKMMSSISMSGQTAYMYTWRKVDVFVQLWHAYMYMWTSGVCTHQLVLSCHEFCQPNQHNICSTSLSTPSQLWKNHWMACHYPKSPNSAAKKNWNCFLYKRIIFNKHIKHENLYLTIWPHVYSI